MILALIAIAGLLLSNKDDVVSFINKHNINWFERNLESNAQINKQPQYKGNDNGNGNGNRNGNGNSKGNNNKFSVPQLQLESSNNKLDSIDSLVSMKNTRQMTGVSRAPNKMQAIQTTVIAITNPPIRSEDVTTQNAPAWKNLINKIVNSNKNEVVAMNTLENLKTKPLPTMAVQLKTTANATPTKIATQAPVQQESSEYLSSSLVAFISEYNSDFHIFDLKQK